MGVVTEGTVKLAVCVELLHVHMPICKSGTCEGVAILRMEIARSYVLQVGPESGGGSGRR